nr:hypothetical protein [uncultured Desulfobulbus sp.]
MRFSDAIEQLAQGNAPILPTENRQNCLNFAPKGKNTTQPGGKNTPGPKNNRPKDRRNRQRRPPKPERLAFLQPCPLCFGRSFVVGNGGGFFCTTCQPGIEGHPVEAAGQASKTGRGSMPVNSRFGHLLPADQQPEQVTEQQRRYFQEAWPWIKENKAQLLKSGWTLAALVGRSKFKWPYGRWGLAWLPVWTRDQLQVTISDKGAIVFTFRYCGKTVQQTANP